MSDNNIKKFTAKKYFLFAMKKYISNSNKIIAKRFSPSIRELLINYIEIYEDMILDLNNKRLINSKVELIQAICFYTEKNIFYQEKIYKEELDYLLKDFKGIISQQVTTSDEHRVYNKCVSLVKKIDNENIYEKLINVVKETKSYDVADKIIESFVSELLYDGISLEYLDEWYNAKISKALPAINLEDIDYYLVHLSELYMKDKEFKYYISIKSKGLLEDRIYLDSNLILIKEDYEKLYLNDSASGKNIKSFIEHDGDNQIYSICIRQKDYYKGIEVLVDSISSYFQMINYIKEDNEEITLNDKMIIQIEENKFIKKRNEKYSGEILFQISERREKRDIQDFIEYRDKVYLNNIKIDEITNIQRAINIIKNQNQQSKENRLINLWSVLEYMLTFHEGNSIIAKVKDIIPKVICLYYIKDKINIFWNDVSRYKHTTREIIHEIIGNCKLENDEYRYDVGKFINYLISKGEKIADELEFNDNLKRQILEIGMLFFIPQKRKEIIENKYKDIEMDLIRIYRDRNIIIHSGRRNIKNIDFKSVRLYNYNNAIIGVIIHYKKKNPNLTIEEILNSIEYTYDKYITEIGEEITDENLINICRAKYLFIS